MKNLLVDLPRDVREEVFDVLAASDDVRIERIVSSGHASANGFWYDQDWHEFVAVLRGAARLRFEDETADIALRPGDFLVIPAHRRHRIQWTTPDEPTVWLAVHYR